MIKALVINFLRSSICACFFGEEQGVGYLSESAFIYVNPNAYVNFKYDCIFFLRNLLLMRNGDFKELGVWSYQIKEPKRYNYMVLYLTSMPLSLSQISLYYNFIQFVLFNIKVLFIFL